MIFINKTLEEWLELHPQLKPFTVRCVNCKELREVNIPFIEKGYAGLMVQDCKCGKCEYQSDVRVTTSEESYNRWADAMFKFI